MSADSRRQLLGILRHYGHSLRAQFRGAGTFIGFAFSVCFALGLGSLATRNSGSPGPLGHGGFLDGASLFDMQMGSALGMTELTLQIVPLFAMTFLVTAAGILFSPNQRRELLCLSAWPIRPPGLALMKLLDGHFWLILATLMAVPGILRGLTWVRSVDSALLLVAVVAQYFGQVLSAYLLTFTFVALGAAWYARGLRARPPLTLFVPAWIALGLVPFALLLFSEGTGIPLLGVAVRNLRHGLLIAFLAGRGGALALTLFWLLAVYGCFRLAWFVVGWGYVSAIERFEGAAARTQPVAPGIGGMGLGWRLLSPPVRAIVRKDLRILSRHPMILITSLTTLILSVVIFKGALHGGLGPALWTVLAATGPILLQVAYHELMTMEGPGGEHLVAFPASAKDIMAGKTLCAFLLNLPLPVLGFVMMSLGGLRVDHVAFVTLWVTWLPSVIVTQLAIAGVFARRKATRMTESRAPLSLYIGFPVQIPFTLSFLLFANLAEIEPLLALVGVAFHLLLALAILRFSTGVLRLMAR
jgi:hypothetical protein